MVISADEKKILLERLQKARETKAAKAAATKAAKAKDAEPPAPAPAPAPVPTPVPAPEAPVVAILEKPPASEPIDIPQVPDLVAMSKKPAKKKKVSLPSSDESDSSDSEVELPAKAGKGKGKGGKKQAYMKIKIYKEPKNTAAFQSLVEAIQDEQPEPEPEEERVSGPPPSASIERGRKFDIKNKTPSQSRTLPTPQELMRRAALEFFS